MSPMQFQVALDLTEPERALTVARQVSTLAVRLEVGTPLLLAEGMGIVRRLRSLYPALLLVADTKICDAGERIARTALEAGADVVTIVPAAADPLTWAGVRKAVAEYRTADRQPRLMADLIGSHDEVEAARRAAAAGADELCLHLPRRAPGMPLDLDEVRRVVQAVGIPVYVAGGLQPADAEALAATGAAGLIVGGAVTAAEEPAAVVRAFRMGDN